MKRKMCIVAIVFGVMMAMVWPVFGAGGGHGGSGGHDGAGHGDGGHSSTGNDQGMGHGMQSMDSSGHGMDQGSHSGMKIHSAEVDGYQFDYELIDMASRMEGMENMPEMSHTHHLMVYVKDGQGHPVDNAKVGYLIEGPDGGKQKTMCMGMGGGYGADVTFENKGSYTVKTKVVAGGKSMQDSFEYELK